MSLIHSKFPGEGHRGRIAARHTIRHTYKARKHRAKAYNKAYI